MVDLETQISSIKCLASLEELEDYRVLMLGRNGLITSELRGLSSIANIDKRKENGAHLNKVKSKIESAIREREFYLKTQNIDKLLYSNRVDVTLPVREKKFGSSHLVSKTIAELTDIFSSMGFISKFGPEIENTFRVFDALNTPILHPARNENDTFYFADTPKNSKNMLLRTHTSSVQVSVMMNKKPPHRIISSGRVYRNDWDMTHTPMFHQLEVLCVEPNINLGHLKFCIKGFLTAFFGKDVEFRFRSSFFPFTEPSLEVDIKLKKQWIEILGCGMVHKNVLKNVGVDTSKYSGFAAGIGIERLVMLKYKLNDIRLLYGSDVSFLNFYGNCFFS